MAGPIPLLNFDFGNPMDTALKAALGTYQGVTAGQSNKTQNQLNKAELPYAEENAKNAAFLKALDAKYAPRKMEADVSKSEQEAALYSDMTKTDMAYKEAMAARANQRTANGPSVTHGIAGLMIARDKAISEGRESDAQVIQRDIDATVRNKEAFNFRSAPPDVKRAMIAEGAGYGIDQAKVIDMLSSGMSLEEIAQSAGIPPEQRGDYTPAYNPTQPNITGAKNREVASVELEYLQPLVNEGIGKYVSKMPVNGYSPQQALDLARNLNPEKQINFMAAQMAIPEIITLRMRQVGAEVSHAQYKELEEKTIGIKKAFEKGMTPEIYKEANNRLNQWLSGAAQVANKRMYQPAIANKANEARNSPISKALEDNQILDVTSGFSDEQLQAIIDKGGK